MAASGAQVRIEGIVPLARAFRKVGDEESRDYLIAANREAANLVESAARGNVPRRTGTLEGTLRSVGNQKGGAVLVGKARVRYAAPIHFGWWKHHIRAQPFLFEALDRRRADIEELHARRLDELCERVMAAANE